MNIIDKSAAYPRVDADMSERVHGLASHLEIHSQFGGFALDAGEASRFAKLLRSTAGIADNHAEAYNIAVERCEYLEHALALSEQTFDRLIGLAKTIGVILAIGALMAVLNWIG